MVDSCVNSVDVGIGNGEANQGNEARNVLG
jgi:hypothetical protein